MAGSKPPTRHWRCIKRPWCARLTTVITNKNKTKIRHLALQFIEYNLAGLAFFWSGYIVLLVLSALGTGLLIASVISYLVGLTINFILERYWVFKENKDAAVLAVATEKYIALSVVNLVLNFLVLSGLIEGIGIPLSLAPFVAAGLFTPWNWLWYKYWVFSKDHHAARKAHKRHRVQRKRGQTK